MTDLEFDHGTLPTLIRRKSALEQGYSDGEILRHRRSGRWKAIAPGAYVEASTFDHISDEQKHRLRLIALGPRLGEEAVISHLSAALIHGFPMFRLPFDKAHITRSPHRTTRQTTNIQVHTGILNDVEVTLNFGIRVSSVARTLFDCARIIPFESAVVMADHALFRHMVTRGELDEILDLHRFTPGARNARRALQFADRGGESVGESRSRVILHRAGIRPPILQRVVFDHDGEFLGRTDFADQEARVVGEFDGRMKYGRLLRPGQDPGDAVFAEKLREDKIRATGLTMVRWTWSDLDRPRDFLRRWAQAIGATT